MSDRDRVLIARAAEGDHDAFTELMGRTEDMVFAVCLRMLGDREAALDATQEVYLTVFRKAHTFRGGSAVTTWLYRIAVNTCYDQLRRRSRRQADPLPDHVDPPDRGAQDALEAAELRPELEGALRRLPEEFLAPVVLADIQGMALPDVAEVLEVPVGTVKSRLFRARRRLAEDLGNRSGPSGHPMGEHHA